MTQNMTQHQNTRKPPVTDLWLLVDEEQTLHYGLRRAWRWAEVEQPRRTPLSWRTRRQPP